MRRVTATVFLLSAAFATNAQGASIGSDCKPAGLVNTAKEAAFPSVFWKKALTEIEDELAGAVQAYRLLTFDRHRARVESALDEQDMRISGIEPTKNPELDRAFADADRLMADLDSALLWDKQRWAEKCRTYARRKLTGQ
jgi:hypothetical protein